MTNLSRIRITVWLFCHLLLFVSLIYALDFYFFEKFYNQGHCKSKTDHKFYMTFRRTKKLYKDRIIQLLCLIYGSINLNLPSIWRDWSKANSMILIISKELSSTRSPKSIAYTTQILFDVHHIVYLVHVTHLVWCTDCLQLLIPISKRNSRELLFIW